MLTLNFDPFPILSTERLVLRRLSVDDGPEIFHHRSDPALNEYLDRAPCASLDEAVAFIRMVNAAIDDNNNVTWGITLKGHGRIIGSIALWRIEKENYRAELGYTLETAQQGKGLMSEALAAVLEHAFGKMGLHSIEANINPANSPSKVLLERHGFIREAYFRENYYHNGHFFDSAIYSLLTPAARNDA
ncbi:MAG: GNAT family N-acetyltransferase [Chitinophagaceae bacterium]|nr:GNAT family N-acetyltransferase [Chitinophagaceae bacterium]